MELTNKLCDIICVIFCQNTKNLYYLCHAKPRLTCKSSLPVFTISYLLRSVFVFPTIPQSLTILIYFSSMPISLLHLESILGTGAGSLGAFPRVSLHAWEGPECLSLRTKGWHSLPARGTGLTTGLCCDVSPVSSAVSLCSSNCRQ